jgi:hypothetical protein
MHYMRQLVRQQSLALARLECRRVRGHVDRLAYGHSSRACCTRLLRICLYAYSRKTRAECSFQRRSNCGVKLATLSLISFGTP